MQADDAPGLEPTVPRLLLGAAERFGDRTAVEDAGRHLSFRELAAEALRAARAVVAAGLEPGDRAGVWAPNRLEWILAALGVQSAGGVVVPLNTRFKGGEAAYVLRKSGARLCFAMGDFLGADYVAALRAHELPRLDRIVAVDRPTPGAQSWEAFLASGAEVPEREVRARAEAVSPDDLSDILFTSGTTGHPKGVMAAHGQSLRAYSVWSEVVNLCPEDRYLVVNPFFHSFGYKAGWLACLMRGATCLPLAVFDVPTVFERVSAERVSVLPGPPTLYQSILTHPERASRDLSSLRLAVTGAAPVSVELVERMRDELGFESVVTGYGLTECCGIVSMCRYDDAPETISHTSGRALPGVEVRCVDAKGREVPRRQPGEILVRGYNVMRGYFEDPVETRKVIDAKGWLHTGDLAAMDERGYLAITGRLKEMFIVGGFNCYPAEIEAQLYASGLFAGVAVIGVPDERMGEVGVAFVVPAPGAEVTPDFVVAWCRANMANYKVPRRVEVVDSLPMNASGKVLKRELLARKS